MRNRGQASFLAATLLAGCAGASSLGSPGPPQYGSQVSSPSLVLPPGVVAPRTNFRLGSHAVSGVRHIFLSDAALNIVTIFGKQTRALGGFNEPQGVTTDAHGTFYVANTIARNVEEFAPPYRGGPSATISTPEQWPVDVAVAKDGTVAVVNICKPSGSSCVGPGSVSFYADNHAQSPCATVSNGAEVSRLLWGGFDAAGTLYVAGINDYTTTKIGAIAGECNAGHLTVLNPNVAISFPGGIEVDPRGRIAVISSGSFSSAAQLDVFAPPRSGSPKLKLVAGGTLSNSGVVLSFSLNKAGTALFTAEPHYSLEYAYPSGGEALAQLSPPPSGGDVIEGVAVTPAEIP